MPVALLVDERRIPAAPVDDVEVALNLAWAPPAVLLSWSLSSSGKVDVRGDAEPRPKPSLPLPPPGVEGMRATGGNAAAGT